jgi:uncharacterized protein with HEPN domain
MVLGFPTPISWIVGLKNLDKITSEMVLTKYPEIDWKKVKGLREIISHHYFDVDAEAIFDVCEILLSINISIPPYSMSQSS